jgi:SAM-dependent methyltransferase
MGILAEPEQFVRELPLRRGFTVCELGDQWITHTNPHRLARDLYVELGCSRYESIDGNGRGTITWDLNRKLPALGQFDLVTDFGTGEHVFNQAQVWRAVHELTKPGGYIVFDRPTKGYPGHCFYLSDESLFHDIAAANSYEVLRLERRETPRGELIRGVWRRTSDDKFRTPQQGRYKKILVI